MREEPRVYDRIRNTHEIAALVKIARALLPGQVQGSLKRRLPSNVRTGKAAQAERQAAEKPIQLLRPHTGPFLASKARVSIDKAKRLLNYRPLDFETGMQHTEQWAQWANLL